VRLLIFEFITGGGMIDTQLPENLLAEGQLMLDAIVNDMLELEHIELMVLRDTRLSKPVFNGQHHNHHCTFVTAARGFQAVWLQAIQQVDAVLPIAPETMGILAGLCDDIEVAGKLLLNSSSHAVGLTSSKLETYRLLQGAGVPVIHTEQLNDALDISPPWVIKPDDGVGCNNVVVIDDRQALNGFIKASIMDDIDAVEELIIQPWVVGQAASLSVIFNENNALLLTYNKQLIEIKQGRVFLNGCRVGLQTKHWELYQSLIIRIAECFPGLKGYVGIDIIETEDGPVVVEINPRLTTSYAGIHKALGVNPACLILQSFVADFKTFAQISIESIKPVSVDLSAFHA
jgi:predicted ATP-grasp superfamily ATP-dependent carboligase